MINLHHIHYNCLKMPSYVILRRVALVRTDVSEDRSACIIRMTIITELE
jgi:hypothetical protein